MHFCAAHRLHRDDWSDERNREVFRNCANPNWHGHNYELDVTVEGPVDPDTGYVMDLKHLRDLVQDGVIDEVDHANLNMDVGWLDGIIPTTENVVVAIWHRLRERMPSEVELVKLVLWETPRNRAEYAGE
jgi:6-pyruvoyltetrahydropterin/6-carboxytetrahydropterin synthase